MPDNRFFQNAGGLSLSQIASLTGATLATGADGNRMVVDIAPLEQATVQQLSFLDNIKYLDVFSKSAAGACFVRQKYAARAPAGMMLLITEEPYTAFAIAALRFYPDVVKSSRISPAAHISDTASIGNNVHIDSGVVIGERVSIGDHCRIGANAVIGDGVVIGSDCAIGACCTLSHAILGNRVVLHRGVHIGQDGFGFAPSAKGILKVPQLGRVLIGNDVEIGSGTCIDRGAGPDTTIGDHTKIDNLVQIGHNVQIGKYVLIAAQCGISGSTQVGDGVMLGGQSGLAGHIKIGNRAKIAAQSGVMADVPDGETYGGSPAMSIRDWHRQSVMLAQMTRKKD